MTPLDGALIEDSNVGLERKKANAIQSNQEKAHPIEFSSNNDNKFVFTFYGEQSSWGPSGERLGESNKNAKC